MGKVAYTGDLTLQSHDGNDTKKFFEAIARDPDILALITEGINVRAEQRGSIRTEREYMEKVDKIIKDSNHKPVFTSFNWSYVNRLISYYELAKDNKRKLVIPLKILFFATKMRELGYNIPDLLSDPDVLIHVPQRKYASKIVKYVFELFGKSVSMSGSKVKQKAKTGPQVYGRLPEERMVTSDWMSVPANAESVIMVLSLSQLNEFNIMKPAPDSPFIYSAGVPFSDGLKALNTKIKTWTDMFLLNWHDLYVSPHINEYDLVQGLNPVDAKYVLPIHTERSWRFKQLFPFKRILLPKPLKEYSLLKNESKDKLTDARISGLEDQYEEFAHRMTDADYVTMLRGLPVLKNSIDFSAEIAGLVNDLSKKEKRVLPQDFLQLMSSYYTGQMLRVKFKEKYLLANEQELAAEAQSFLSAILDATLDFYKKSKKSLNLEAFDAMILGDFSATGKYLREANLVFVTNLSGSINVTILARLIAEAMYEITGGAIGLNPDEPVFENKLEFLHARINSPNYAEGVITEQNKTFPGYAYSRKSGLINSFVNALTNQNLISKANGSVPEAPAPGLSKIFDHIKDKLSEDSRALADHLKTTNNAAKLLNSLTVVKSRDDMRAELSKYAESRTAGRTTDPTVTGEYYQAQLLRLEVAQIYHTQSDQDILRQKEILNDVCSSHGYLGSTAGISAMLSKEFSDLGFITAENSEIFTIDSQALLQTVLTALSDHVEPKELRARWLEAWNNAKNRAPNLFDNSYPLAESHLYSIFYDISMMLTKDIKVDSDKISLILQLMNLKPYKGNWEQSKPWWSEGIPGVRMNNILAENVLNAAQIEDELGITYIVTASVYDKKGALIASHFPILYGDNSGFASKDVARIHAEQMLIKKLTDMGCTDFSKYTLVVSWEPCEHCSRHILYRGFKKVVFTCYDSRPELFGLSSQIIKLGKTEVVTPEMLEPGLEKHSLAFIRNNYGRLGERKPGEMTSGEWWPMATQIKHLEMWKDYMNSLGKQYLQKPMELPKGKKQLYEMVRKFHFYSIKEKSINEDYDARIRFTSMIIELMEKYGLTSGYPLSVVINADRIMAKKKLIESGAYGDNIEELLKDFQNKIDEIFEWRLTWKTELIKGPHWNYTLVGDKANAVELVNMLKNKITVAPEDNYRFKWLDINGITPKLSDIFDAQNLKQESSPVQPVQTADSNDKTLKELSRELNGLLPNNNLPLLTLDICERCYRYTSLEHAGLLLNNGEPCGKMAASVKKILLKKYLALKKDYLKQQGYNKLLKGISTFEGIINLGQMYLDQTGVMALGSWSITFDSSRNAYIIKLNRAEALSGLGRLAQTEYARFYHYNKLIQWSKGWEKDGVKIIIEDDQNTPRGSIAGLIETGQLGRLADNHGHIEGQVGSNFLWGLTMGSVDLPKGISREFRDALYPEKTKNKEVTAVIDWNNKGPDYVDNNQLLIAARKIRGKLIKDTVLPNTVSNANLLKAAMESGKSKVIDDIRTYFSLKHVFLNKALSIPYEGEGCTFMEFLNQHDTFATILKRRMKGGEMLKQDFALLTGMFVRQIIEEYKDNSYIEIRIQPKYDQEEMELAMKEAAKAVSEAKEKYPDLAANLVMVFRKRDSDQALRSQLTWFLDALRNDAKLRECFRGWDAASLEAGNPPEKFQFIANAVQQYNSEGFPRLNGTYHVAQGDEAAVGGKGHDIVTSMRYVDDVIEKLNCVSLGHALGVMFAFTGKPIEGPQEVNRGELLTTLNWLKQLNASDKIKVDISRVENTIQSKLDEYREIEGDPLIHFDKSFLNDMEAYQVARYVVKKIIDKNIFVEFNPTANVGSLYNMHPLTKLLMSDFVSNGEKFEGLRELVTINSDTPGMESINGVKDEFINIGAELIRQGMPPDKVANNLKILARNGRRRGILFTGKHNIIDVITEALELLAALPPIKDTAQASAKAAEATIKATEPKVVIEDLVDRAWKDKTSKLNFAKKKVNKIIKEIVSSYSLVIISQHHFVFPIDTDSFVFSAVTYKRLIKEAEKQGRSVELISDPEKAKNDGKLYICLFPISAINSGYMDEDKNKLNLAELEGKRALFVGDVNFGNAAPYKRNKSFGFDTIVVQDHHKWPDDLVAKLDEYSDDKTIYLNTHLFFDDKLADAYCSGAFQSDLLSTNRSNWDQFMKQLALVGDQYYRRDFPNYMKGVNIEEARYISDMLSLLGPRLAELKPDKNEQREVLMKVVQIMAQSKDFKELKTKLTETLSDELGKDFILYYDNVIALVEKSIEVFLASKEKIVFYKIDLPGDLTVTVSKMANDRLSYRKQFGYRALAHYQILPEGEVGFCIARGKNNENIDVSEPCINGPEGVNWGGGHENRAGFRTINANPEVKKKIQAWWGPEKNPQKVLDFVKANIENQYKKQQNNAVTKGKVIWINDIPSRPDLIEQQLSGSMLNSSKESVVVFEHLDEELLTLYRKVARGEISPSRLSDNRFIKEIFKHKEEELENFKTETAFMHLKVLYALYSLGKTINVETTPDNTYETDQATHLISESENQAANVFCNGDTDRAAEELKLCLEAAGPAAVERDEIIHSYINELYARNPALNLIIVREAMNFGLAKQLKTEGFDVALKWWKPRIQGLRMDQMAVLLSKYLIEKEMGKTTVKLPEEKIKMKLLRYLVGTLLRPAYAREREIKVLEQTINNITGRLDLKDLEELSKYISKRIDETDEDMGQIKTSVLKNGPKKNNYFDLYQAKKNAVIAGYILRWLIDSGKIHEREFNYFPYLNYFITEFKPEAGEADSIVISNNIPRPGSDRQAMDEIIQELLKTPESNIKIINQAYEFAREAYKGRIKADGEPLIYHAARVAHILMFELGCRDEEVLAAALLHDVIEKGGASSEQLSAKFGSDIATLVEFVSKPDEPATNIEKEKRLAMTMINPQAPLNAHLIKFMEKLDHFRDFDRLADESYKKKYIKRMTNVFLPFLFQSRLSDAVKKKFLAELMVFPAIAAQIPAELKLIVAKPDYWEKVSPEENVSGNIKIALKVARGFIGEFTLEDFIKAYDNEGFNNKFLNGHTITETYARKNLEELSNLKFVEIIERGENTFYKCLSVASGGDPAVAFVKEFDNKYTSLGVSRYSLIGKDGDMSVFFDLLTGLFGRYGLGRDERKKEGERLLGILSKLPEAERKEFIDKAARHFGQYTYLSSGAGRYLSIMLAIESHLKGSNIFGPEALEAAKKHLEGLQVPDKNLLDDAIKDAQSRNLLFSSEAKNSPPAPETLLLPNPKTTRRYLDIGAGYNALGLRLGQMMFGKRIKWEGTDIFFPVFEEKDGKIRYLGQEALYKNNGITLYNAAADPNSDIVRQEFDKGPYRYISISALFHHLKPEGAKVEPMPVVDLSRQESLKDYKLVLRGKGGDKEFDRKYIMAREQQDVIARAFNALEDRGVLFLNFAPFWSMSELWFGNSPEKVTKEESLQSMDNGLTYWMIQRDDANKQFIIYDNVLSFNVVYPDTLERFLDNKKILPGDIKEDARALIRQADSLVFAAQTVDHSRMRAVLNALQEAKRLQTSRQPLGLSAILEAYLAEIPADNSTKIDILKAAQELPGASVSSNNRPRDKKLSNNQQNSETQTKSESVIEPQAAPKASYESFSQVKNKEQLLELLKAVASGKEDVPVISIQSLFADRIFEGNKTAELRKRFTKKPFSYMLLYSSGKEMKLSGVIKVKKVHLDMSVAEIKQRFLAQSMDTAQEVDSYYENADKGCVIEIEDAFRFRQPVPLDELRKEFNFNAPQNFMFFNNLPGDTVATDKDADSQSNLAQEAQEQKEKDTVAATFIETDEIVKNIKSEQDLDKIVPILRKIFENCWSDKTRHPDYLGDELLSSGQCWVTALVLAKTFGWEFYYNKQQHQASVRINNFIVDLTSDQKGFDRYWWRIENAPAVYTHSKPMEISKGMLSNKRFKILMESFSKEYSNTILTSGARANNTPPTLTSPATKALFAKLHKEPVSFSEIWNMSVKFAPVEEANKVALAVSNRLEKTLFTVEHFAGASNVVKIKDPRVNGYIVDLANSKVIVERLNMRSASEQAFYFSFNASQRLRVLRHTYAKLMGLQNNRRYSCYL